jgi:predicted transcriptional regulator
VTWRYEDLAKARVGGGRIAEMPCEYAAREIIPSIRAALAVVMVEKGASRYKVASILGLTPAAVTYYISGKRGGRFLEKILSDPQLRKPVEKVGSILLSGESIRVKERAFRTLICYICSKLNKYACDAPFTKDEETLLEELLK